MAAVGTGEKPPRESSRSHPVFKKRVSRSPRSRAAPRTIGRGSSGRSTSTTRLKGGSYRMRAVGLARVM